MRERRRRRQRPGRKKRQDRRGIVVAAVAVLTLVGLIGTWVYVQGQRVELNSATYCPKSGAPAVTVLLIDRTDPLNPIQKLSVENELEVVANSLARYERLEVYTLDRDQQWPLEPAVAMCNPGRGEDVSSLINNPRIAERRWQRAFSQPLDSALESALKGGEASRSPLMEAIQSVAVSTFSRPELKRKPGRLYIVSDMLQHSDALSHYRRTPSFKQFSSQQAYQRLVADLSGVDVEILYLGRPAAGANIQGRSHVRFWQLFFADQGATVQRVKRVEG